MAVRHSTARNVLLAAGVTAAAYFAFLFAVVTSPFGRLTLDDRAFMATIVALGVPMGTAVGLLIWYAARLGAAELAYRDDMTGLPNRRAFMRDASALVKGANAGSVALVLLDVDRLKKLNDSCGHQAGDELIRLAARQMEKVAAGNGRVYRVGGDEFAILVARDDGGRLSPVMRGLSALDSRFRTCNHVHSVSLSFGYASCNQGESFEALFRRSDQRLYEGKEVSPARRAAAGDTQMRRTSVAAFGFAPDEPASAPDLALVHSRD
ncbi:MAG TPA: GGDEF domain-containing protein [Dehalococcoidia bacterium]|jgi:diguanylate cyclase (GGDEF)-like protein